MVAVTDEKRSVGEEGPGCEGLRQELARERVLVGPSGGDDRRTGAGQVPFVAGKARVSSAAAVASAVAPATRVVSGAVGVPAAKSVPVSSARLGVDVEVSVAARQGVSRSAR